MNRVIFNSIQLLSFLFLLFLVACKPDPIETGNPIVIDTEVYANSNQHWTDQNPDGVDYIIRGKLLFSQGSKLTVDPGTEVVFENNAYMEFNTSSIYAIGTAGKPILFRGQASSKGFWKGFAFLGKTDNALAYCQIEDAGGSAGPSSGELGSLIIGTALGEAGLSLENCRIANSGSHALNIHGESTLVQFTNNTITNCEDVAAVTSNSLGQLVGTSNTFSGNTHDQVIVKGSQVLKSAVWPALPVSYLFTGTTNLYNEVTIEPGALLLFDNAADFVLYKNSSSTAKLFANGTPAKPIFFKGANSTPGYWKGIKVDAGLAQFSYCTIADAGNAGASPNNANIYITKALGSVDVSIQNCTISNSSNHGLAIRTNTVANVVLSNNLFTAIAGENIHNW